MSTFASIHSLIQSWDAWEPLRHSNFDQAEAIAGSLTAGTAQGVADGSYNPNLSSDLATAAWCLEPSSAVGTSCSGVTAVSGVERDRNAYRAELVGIHTLLMAVKAICTYHDVSEGSMDLYCDCEKALLLSSYDELQVGLSTKHLDLVRAIRKLHTSLPIDVRFQDIEGHQDDDVEYEDLDRPAQLNVDMDRTAKAYLRKLFYQDEIISMPQEVHEEGWRCILHETKLTSHPAEPIRFHVAAVALRAHLNKKGTLPAAFFYSVDWEANGGALPGFPQLFRLWATKHISGFCGVGRHMKIRGEWEEDKCPSCDETERAQHVVVCPCPQRQDEWREVLVSLEAWFDVTKTDPEISKCILRSLAPREPTSFTTHAGHSLLLQMAADEQDSIGWMNFVEGRLSQKWKNAQAAYYLSIDTNRSARLWAEGLVQQLLSGVHKMWIARNAVVHERDEEGRYVKEKIATENAIDAEFEKEYEDLRPQDFHLIDCGKEAVMNKTATDQQAWLHYIATAREIGIHETDTTITQLRNDMFMWLHGGN